MQRSDAADRQCPDLSDSDLRAALQDVQGYLDVTPADLKELYRHAYRHALERVGRMVKAADIMTRVVHHVRKDAPLREVAELMAEERVSGVPVLDEEGRVAGIVSESDFLARMGASGTAHLMGLVAACLAGGTCAASSIRGRVAADIMAAPAVTVREDASSFEILEIFSARRVNRVPVVDMSGRLLGIVSRADILRAQATLPE